MPTRNRPDSQKQRPTRRVRNPREKQVCFKMNDSEYEALMAGWSKSPDSDLPLAVYIRRKLGVQK